MSTLRHKGAIVVVASGPGAGEQHRLAAQVAAVPEGLPAVPTADPAWLLVEEGFDRVRERDIESLFTSSNGYAGVRGSLAEGGPFSSPVTYVAGVFQTPPGVGAVPELATVPDWTHLRVIVAGEELNLGGAGVLEHRRVLDLLQGMLWREWRHRDAAGRVTRLRFLRLASLADRPLLLQCVTVTAENYGGPILFESRYRLVSRELVAATSGACGTATHPAPPEELSGSPEVLALDSTMAGGAARLMLHLTSRCHTEEGQLLAPTLKMENGALVQHWAVQAEPGRTYRLERLASLHTERGGRVPPAAPARPGLAFTAGVQAAAQTHTRAWAERWRAADVRVDGDPEAQRALRFAAFHLIGAANPEDERSSVGARALTGDSYKGHVFWDSEIFMLPFYVFTDPPTARSLLLYRYHTLPAARDKAHGLGYDGALYAWESTDSGREATPDWVPGPDGRPVRVLAGEQEHHVSADVAYAVWQYWRASGDDRFFLDAGAEIMLETARFWASRGRWGSDGRYHIARVIGPDEYHEGVDDNAYTNALAAWNLRQGAAAARLLERRWPGCWRDLSWRLGLSPEEPARWRATAGNMYTGLDRQTLLFEQFRGYFGLEEIDLAAYNGRTAPMDVVLGRERTQRSKVVKQADVVMLLHLLWDRLEPDVREANFCYYEPRTGHGSSLSPAVHAAVAARLGKIALAGRYFRQASQTDLADGMGNVAGGVHMASLGGLWQAALLGFAGMSLRPGGLAFDPCLPPGWRGLSFRVRWRGRNVSVVLGGHPRTAEVEVEGPGPVAVALAGGPPTHIAPGRRRSCRWEGAAWGSWSKERTG